MWTLRRKNVSFSSGDLVFLEVSPMKKVVKFDKKGKLAPRHIEPFESWWSDVKISVTARMVDDLSSFARVDVEKGTLLVKVL